MNHPEKSEPLTHGDCLDYDDSGRKLCHGPVELRHPLSATGVPHPRCEHHWDLRLEKQEEINRKYAPTSDVPPADFDPSYAGERWDEDY